MNRGYIVMVRGGVPLYLGEKVAQAHAQAIGEARRLQEAQPRSRKLLKKVPAVGAIRPAGQETVGDGHDVPSQ